MKKADSKLIRPVYLGSFIRSPIGRFGGSLKGYSAGQLSALVLAESVKRSGVNPSAVDFVFLGHARQAGNGPNSARQAVIFSGLSDKVPGQTVNQACASGLAAIVSAAEKIQVKRATNIFAGGVEMMSRTPYYLMSARWGERMGNKSVVDGMWKDGFFCPMAEMVMGETVENYLVKELKISRKEQDEYALRSQRCAVESWNKNLFKSEILELPELSKDEHMRADTELASLQKLKPVFDLKSGTVTAGNSSGITDGAAFCFVTGEKSAGKPTLELLDYETTALDPNRMGLGPIEATQRILKRNGLLAADIEAVELNEAFAAQVIACQRELKFSEDKVNSWGGAIALGHPIGATGARILTTLDSRLSGQSGALGIATLCVSGGHGVAVLVKAL